MNKFTNFKKAAIAAIFMTGSFAAFAGEKNIKAEIVSPAASTVINSGKEFTLKVKITNGSSMYNLYGPMVGMPGMEDKIQVDLKIDGKIEASPVFALTADVKPGESITLEKKITLNFSADKASAQFCAVVAAVGYPNANANASDCETVAQKVFATSVSTVTSEGSIQVYPNPASSHITIDAANAMKGNVAIVDLTGRVALQQQLNDKLTTVSLSSLPAGTYLYRLSTEEGLPAGNGKIVVNH